MVRRVEMIGLRFGRLTVVSEAAAKVEASGRKRRMFNCRCDCDADIIAEGHGLREGNTRSCGCLQRETVAKISMKHGDASRSCIAPEYRSWHGMMQRCYYEPHKSYDDYGRRGIDVCDRWRFGEGAMSGYECFLADVGRKPSPQHSIDRYPNNDGNYEPGNVRWATRSDQNTNKRRAA